MTESERLAAEGACGAAGTATTFLFVPGSRPDRFDKALKAGADIIVLDLEDAVTEDDKDEALASVTSWLSQEGNIGAVRVNGAGHHDRFEADLAALADVQGLAAIVVPMAADVAAVARAHEVTGAPVVALVETALGLLRAADMAAAPGVVRLAFGHLDFAADIGSDTGPEAMLLARSTLVVASRAAGLAGPVDGVTTELDDPGVASEDAGRAACLGFTGKFCIHPRQIAAVSAAFAPSADEVAWARRVLHAAESGGAGAVRFDGHMVDAPVLNRAKSVLAREGDRA
ncbi:MULTISPECIES: HpcH/HpaI aldolase/citrate lyase family protein [unclassified Janibacter]|uniref:HpcH/HpaI aldolase/citrate lyase family protein n=1 Tax=unclassified Janibacter TaxID=2649294 RepID=UPI003CFCEFA7